MKGSVLTSATYFFVGIVELLVSLRVLLKLFGASENALFVQWIYDISYLVLFPFDGMFGPLVFSATSVLELSSVFALIVYLFIGYLAHKLLELLNDSASTLLTKIKTKK